MKTIKILLIVACFLSSIVCFGQTNTKYQSRINTSEALYKIESAEAGSAWMSGYHTVNLRIILRRWTNLATNTKRYDIELMHDVASYIEKGDWDYTLNSLKYMQEALKNNPKDNTEYTFRTATGIMFTTRKGDVYVVLPGDTYGEHKLPLESLDKVIEALQRAIDKVKSMAN